MPPAPHVLIVDDHPAVRAVLAHVVTQFAPDATIAETANGAEALHAIAEHQPDLIITDYQMPVMDGLELIRRLRAQGAAIPILVLSSDASVAEAILTSGATAFLAKPFSIRELRKVLRTLLSDDAESSAVGE